RHLRRRRHDAARHVTASGVGSVGSGGALGAVVVGAGFGCITHVRALRAAGFDVRGVVGNDPDRTQERARQFGVDRAFTSLDDALAGEGVDAVTVATPPHTHAGLVVRAL